MQFSFFMIDIDNIDHIDKLKALNIFENEVFKLHIYKIDNRIFLLRELLIFLDLKPFLF
jgi:hypothetical protein